MIIAGVIIALVLLAMIGVLSWLIVENKKVDPVVPDPPTSLTENYEMTN